MVGGPFWGCCAMKSPTLKSTSASKHCCNSCSQRWDMEGINVTRLSVHVYSKSNRKERSTQRKERACIKRSRGKCKYIGIMPVSQRSTTERMFPVPFPMIPCHDATIITYMVPHSLPIIVAMVPCPLSHSPMIHQSLPTQCHNHYLLWSHVPASKHCCNFCSERLDMEGMNITRLRVHVYYKSNREEQSTQWEKRVPQ